MTLDIMIDEEVRRNDTERKSKKDIKRTGHGNVA